MKSLLLKFAHLFIYIEFTGSGNWYFSSREIPQQAAASGFESALIKSHYNVEPSRQHEMVQRPDLDCLLRLGDARLRQHQEKDCNLFSHIHTAL